MRCILASAHGDDVDSLLYMCRDHPTPKRKDSEVLIEVHACALAPGDVRVLAGHVDYWQEPPNGFPYIPGGDVSGVVVEADEGSRFGVGDEVMAMFEIPRPMGGLAEFISAKEGRVEMAPKSVPLMEASALPSSALSAMNAAREFVRNGDRVLVLGGAGGVGTFFVQLAKGNGASHVTVTSSTGDDSLLRSLGADYVLNYQERNWWEDEELLSHHGPLDLVVDLAVGREAWIQSRKSGLLNSHGRFLSFTQDQPLVEIHSLRQTLTTIGRLQCRMLWTRLWPFAPRYYWHENGLVIKSERLAKVSRLVDDGMKIVLDPISPLPFSEEGVKRGYKLMQKRHANGKVVISIKDLSTKAEE